MSDPKWQPWNLDALRARLVEVKDLLEQAAVVGAVQDAGRLEAMARLAQKTRENDDGRRRRRRYR
jgi:hypothetical protein